MTGSFKSGVERSNISGAKAIVIAKQNLQALRCWRNSESRENSVQEIEAHLEGRTHNQVTDSKTCLEKTSRDSKNMSCRSSSSYRVFEATHVRPDLQPWLIETCVKVPAHWWRVRDMTKCDIPFLTSSVETTLERRISAPGSRLSSTKQSLIYRRQIACELQPTLQGTGHGSGRMP